MKKVKDTERLNEPSIKLVDSPKKEVRKVDNLYAMQNFAMEEMLKALYKK
tara:strand:- start:1814 stop:1963 length:150 start_codon:yes stop_codon:yes gene_type:complete